MDVAQTGDIARFPAAGWLASERLGKVNKRLGLCWATEDACHVGTIERAVSACAIHTQSIFSCLPPHLLLWVFYAFREK